jgi:hypothetical protein
MIEDKMTLDRAEAIFLLIGFVAIGAMIGCAI